MKSKIFGSKANTREKQGRGRNAADDFKLRNAPGYQKKEIPAGTNLGV